MNDYEKSQSSKILAVYGIDSNEISKSKGFEIGQVDKSGKHVKTAEGWKPIKTHSHLLNKQPEPAQTQPEKIPVVESNLKNQIRKFFHFDNPPVDQILTAVQPKLDYLISLHEEAAKANDQKFDDRDREYLELAYVASLIGAVGSYIKPTDVLENMHLNSSVKGFEIYSNVDREGIKYRFETEAISAGGYNIQQFHYRYITKTNLPAIFNKPLKQVEARIKYLNEADKLEKKIQEQKDVIKRYEATIEKLKLITKEGIKKQIEDDEIGRYGHILTWNNLHNDSYAKKNYTADQWNQKNEDHINERYEQEQRSIKSHQSYIKDCQKKITKYEQQLKEHLESKEKFENPQEGDIRIERGKNPYIDPNIYIKKFIDGNWKQIRRTNTKTVRAYGFNPMKNDDVLKYHEIKEKEPKDGTIPNS